MSGLTIINHVGPSPEQWDMTIKGMRNSWESWEKGDSYLAPNGKYRFGPADCALALRLACLGADHGKYLRMLPVLFELKAPGYWWREFDTYRVGVEAPDVTQNSTSMMHILGKHEFTADMFCFEDMPKGAQSDILDMLNVLREQWIDAGKRKGPEVRAWRALQQAIPYGWLYTRTISLNYQVLRSICHARRHHRLAEWRDLCTWMATLDYSDLITTETAK